MKAKAIIFDKDGTLFPYYVWYNPIRKFLSSEIPLSKLDKENREKCIDEFSFIIGFNKDGSVNNNGLFLKKNYISTRIIGKCWMCWTCSWFSMGLR